MRNPLVAALVFSVAAFSTPASAEDAADDDYAWINSCIARSMKHGAADDDTAHGYCACIDNAMGDEEVNDIDGWEKSNPAKVEVCRDAAGWK
jgi:hypothetical protein